MAQHERPRRKNRNLVPARQTATRGGRPNTLRQGDKPGTRTGGRTRAAL